jgi:hypothetical protein
MKLRDYFTSSPSISRKRQFVLCLIIALPVIFTCTGCDETKDEAASPPPTGQTPTSKPTLNRTYGYGAKISFAEGGTATQYQVSGWSAAETDACWTEGDAASLAFTLPPTESDIVFKATVSGFTKPPELPSQPVDIFIDGKQITHWEIATKGVVQMVVPAGYVRDGQLQIDFKLPKASSPASLGVSVDQRRLGLRFFDVELVKP